MKHKGNAKFNLLNGLNKLNGLNHFPVIARRGRKRNAEAISTRNAEHGTLNPFYFNHSSPVEHPSGCGHKNLGFNHRLTFYKIPFSFCVNLVKSCGFILKSTINNLQSAILNFCSAFFVNFAVNFRCGISFSLRGML